MSKTLDKSEIVRNFQGLIHCSQIVMKQWAEDLGYNEDEALRFTAPLGGGCFNGDVCGCVSAAMVVIGMKHGHCELGDVEGNAHMMQKVAEFHKRFLEKHGSIVCRQLTGYDFSKEGELARAMEAGKLFDVCPNYVNSALEILDEIM